MESGVYCLVFENPSAVLEVGRLGAIAFRPGYHCYVGSALGPGGLARVERHLRLGRERHRRPHWHVDALLLDSRFRLAAVVSAFTRERLECELARAIGGETVAGFGATDCRCGSHLAFRIRDPIDEVAAAFSAVRLAPRIARFKNDFEKAMVTGEED